MRSRFRALFAIPLLSVLSLGCSEDAPSSPKDSGTTTPPAGAPAPAKQAGKASRKPPKELGKGTGPTQLVE